MAENVQSAKSKKDTFLEAHKGRHPELNAEDEEGFYGSLSDDYANYDNRISDLENENTKYKKDQDDFIAAMSSNENNSEFVDGMMNGRDWVDTAIGIHGYDGLVEYLQSEEARQKYKEADERHKEKLENIKKIDEEASRNAEKTDADIQKAIEEGRFTQEEYNNALSQLFDISDGLELNVCKPEWIEMILAANNHDADVDKAREDGRKEGRNEGLEENIGKRKNTARNEASMPVGMGGRAGGGEKKNGNGSKWGNLLLG